MVDFNKVAIADVLKHPKYGIVSHQPDFKTRASEILRTRNGQGDIIYLRASECEFASKEEKDQYWADLNKLAKKEIDDE